MPFLTAGLNSGNEDAAIAVGGSIFYPSTYGYEYPSSAETGSSVPESALFVGGMQRVDVLADGSGIQPLWANNSTASAAEPRLSLSDNLIYTVTFDATTQIYSFVSIDPGTGAILSRTPYGSGFGANPLQMVSLISPDGVLYQGTERGILRVQAVPEPSVCVLLALGGAVLAWVSCRKRPLRRKLPREGDEVTAPF